MLPPILQHMQKNNNASIIRTAFQLSSQLKEALFSDTTYLGNLDHREFYMFFNQMFMSFVHTLTRSTHSGPFHKALVSYLIVIK